MLQQASPTKTIAGRHYLRKLWFVFVGSDSSSAVILQSFSNSHFCPCALQLTGLWAYYTTEDDSLVQERVLAGERPYIDPLFRNNSSLADSVVQIWTPERSSPLQTHSDLWGSDYTITTAG